jgi:hypothetical protein
MVKRFLWRMLMFGEPPLEFSTFENEQLDQVFFARAKNMEYPYLVVDLDSEHRIKDQPHVYVQLRKDLENLPILFFKKGSDQSVVFFEAKLDTAIKVFFQIREQELNS